MYGYKLRPQDAGWDTEHQLNAPVGTLTVLSAWKEWSPEHGPGKNKGSAQTTGCPP